MVQHSMDIKFAHRLSYKQARLTVLVGFVLGTLLSLIQIGIDYASEDASINREIRSLIEISHNPASRIAYNIDAELAQELTLGLLHSPAIIRAQLIDNNGVVLADVNRKAGVGAVIDGRSAEIFAVQALLLPALGPGTARVLMMPRSVPQWASVRHMVPVHCPAVSLPRYNCFCSALPWA